MPIGTPTKIATTTAATSGVHVATTVDAPVGSLIVVIIAHQSSNVSISGVTDSAGNTYSQAAQSTQTAAILSSAIFYSSNTPNDLPSGGWIAVATPSGNVAFDAFMVSGANAGLDKTNSTTSASATSSPLTTGALSSPSEIVFGAINPANSITAGYTEATGFTTLEGCGGAQGASAYDIVNSAGSVAYNTSWTTARACGMTLASFIASGASAARFTVSGPTAQDLFFPPSGVSHTWASVTKGTA